jgi:hypothetical protein
MSRKKEGRIPPFGKEITYGTDVVPMRIWEFTDNRSYDEPASELTLEDFENAKRLIEDSLRRQLVEFEREFIEGICTGFTAPVKPGLYAENYKSAVVDKNGKVVRVIE